jgi:hypothetical protein
MLGYWLQVKKIHQDIIAVRSVIFDKVGEVSGKSVVALYTVQPVTTARNQLSTLALFIWTGFKCKDLNLPRLAAER